MMRRRRDVHKCRTCTRPELGIHLDSFTVSLLPGEPAALLEQAEEAARWSLLTLEPAPGYVACVAVKGKRWH